MFNSLSTLLLLLPLLSLAQPAVNRTFTLTTISAQPQYANLPVLVGPPSGLAALLIGRNFSIPTVPAELFIHEGQLYRTCTTSPTGACLAILSKNFGGALTGWNFLFSETEAPINIGPGSGPLYGNFSVHADPEATAPRCKPKPLLLWWFGQSTWTLCTVNPVGWGVNSMPILPDVVNGPQCSPGNSAAQFKVTYTQ